MKFITHEQLKTRFTSFINVIVVVVNTFRGENIHGGEVHWPKAKQKKKTLQQA
jgi:hypothetical protein